MQKLAERKAAFKKMAFTPEAKNKYEVILTLDFISSDASGEDSDHEEVLYVGTLPWCSARAKKIFDSLDEQCRQGKSSEAQCQSKKRVASNYNRLSNRPKLHPAPSWAVV